MDGLLVPFPLSWIPYNLVLLRARQRQHPHLRQPQLQVLLSGQILESPVHPGVKVYGVLNFLKVYPKSGLFLIERDSKPTQN